MLTNGCRVGWACIVVMLVCAPKCGTAVARGVVCVWMCVDVFSTCLCVLGIVCVCVCVYESVCVDRLARMWGYV